ncbi:DMT family transporter [Cupriavidus basilensis]
MLLAMLAYAVYVILLKRWNMKDVPALQLLYLQIVVAVVALLPLYLLTPRMGLSAANLPLVGFAGLMASMVAPLVWMHTVASIGPSRASMFFNLIPLLTALIAAVVIGESLAAYHALGGAPDGRGCAAGRVVEGAAAAASCGAVRSRRALRRALLPAPSRSARSAGLRSDGNRGSFRQ